MKLGGLEMREYFPDSSYLAGPLRQTAHLAVRLI